MKRKNYLLRELSKEEKAYLKNIVLSAKNTYLKKNWNQLYLTSTLKEDMIDISDELSEIAFRNYEKEIDNIFEFKNLFTNKIIYKTIEALSVKELMVLFLVCNKDKTINEISKEMRISRETVWRIKKRVFRKIISNLLGGEIDV